MRIKRICSEESDFKRHCQKLVGLLRRRGFKMGLIKEGIRKATAVDRSDLLKECTEEKEKDSANSKPKMNSDLSKGNQVLD